MELNWKRRQKLPLSGLAMFVLSFIMIVTALKVLMGGWYSIPAFIHWAVKIALLLGIILTTAALVIGRFRWLMLLLWAFVIIMALLWK